MTISKLSGSCPTKSSDGGTNISLLNALRGVFGNCMPGMAYICDITNNESVDHDQKLEAQVHLGVPFVSDEPEHSDILEWIQYNIRPGGRLFDSVIIGDLDSIPDTISPTDDARMRSEHDDWYHSSLHFKSDFVASSEMISRVAGESSGLSVYCSTNDCQFYKNGKLLDNPNIHEGHQISYAIAKLTEGMSLSFVTRAVMGLPRANPAFRTISNFWVTHVDSTPKKDATSQLNMTFSNPVLATNKFALQLVSIGVDIITEKIKHCIKMFKLSFKNSVQAIQDTAITDGNMIIRNDQYIIPPIIVDLLQEHNSVLFSGYDVGLRENNTCIIKYKTDGQSICDVLDDILITFNKRVTDLTSSLQFKPIYRLGFVDTTPKTSHMEQVLSNDTDDNLQDTDDTDDNLQDTDDTDDNLPVLPVLPVLSVKETKDIEKEAKKAIKLADKEAKKAAKLAEKEAMKEAKKAAKLAEKEAKKAAKKATNKK